MSDTDVSIENPGQMQQMLQYLWESVVENKTMAWADRTCNELVVEYQAAGRTPYENAVNFIEWQSAKAAGVGFVLGMPGGVAGLATIPIDLMASTYFQMRMVAVIGLLYGWELKSDRLKTAAFLSLLGSSAGEVLREVGVAAGVKIGGVLLAQIPGRMLIEINKAVGFRLLTKAGATGIVNIVRLVPLFGGAISGIVNGTVTHSIGYAAIAVLKDGPDGQLAIGDESSVPQAEAH